MSGKALKLIQPVSKRDQVVASFKEAILSGIISLIACNHQNVYNIACNHQNVSKGIIL